ncbi:MAG: amine dehydrogenase large subunit [Pseudomonadota bacterium]
MKDLLLPRLLVTCLALFGAPARADLAPETISVETLGEPQSSWFLAKDMLGSASLFDAATGEMLGLLSLTPFTPTVQPNLRKGEIYAAEAYYSRLYDGERNDVLTVYSTTTLARAAEIEIPDKIASLPFRQYIALMDDDTHLVLFNMIPAQSVSVVNIETRQFVSEITTPGCALIMPVANRSFLQQCGDGRLQKIVLGANGEEVERVRSDVFFSVEEDPVYDKPLPLGGGWLMVSFEGKVFEAGLEDDGIGISEPWSLLSEADQGESWRIGGGQILAMTEDGSTLFALMHQGGVDTHEDPGTEVWVYDRQSQRRIGRLQLEVPAMNLFVTATEQPMLLVSDVENQIHIFDAQRLRKLRTIEDPGQAVGMFQHFHQ